MKVKRRNIYNRSWELINGLDIFSMHNVIYVREAGVQPQVGRLVLRGDHVGDPLPHWQTLQWHAKGYPRRCQGRQKTIFLVVEFLREGVKKAY